MLLLIYIRNIRRSAHDYPWVHLGVALFGNFAFVVGSLFFLSPTLTRAGTWLFVVASWGMLIGVIGEIMARYEAKQREKEVARVAVEVAAAAERNRAT
ncbi:YrhK-like protein [Actinomycetospora succinea]|uniref:YrhK-like protein n=1 Tax=Actinomycetospora succinea TaxID=663603 RepID=A0A4R6UVT6_9PSEU|nr:YrhK family protein [Actinomycetospora succinea]TDQ50079.1 YrhK-like protein [Actinomycetospora succinea]